MSLHLIPGVLGSLSGLHTEHKWFYDFSLLWIVFTGDCILGTPWLHLAHRHVLFYTVSKKWGISYSYLDLGLAVRNRRSDSQGPVFLDGSHSTELSSGWLSSTDRHLLLGPPWSHLASLIQSGQCHLPGFPSLGQEPLNPLPIR